MSRRADTSPAAPAVVSHTNGVAHVSVPIAKRLAWLLVKDPEKLDESEKAMLQQLQQHPAVAKCHALGQQFTRMVRHQLLVCFANEKTGGVAQGVS